MHIFLRCCLFLGLIATSMRARDIGEVKVTVDNQTIPIRITASSPDLREMALVAFNTHGRYDISNRRQPAYDFKFTATGPTQVRVDITKGSAATPVGSQVVNGSSLR